MDFNNKIAFYYENAGRQKLLHTKLLKKQKY